jgi:hypothetical protein
MFVQARRHLQHVSRSTLTVVAVGLLAGGGYYAATHLAASPVEGAPAAAGAPSVVGPPAAVPPAAAPGTLPGLVRAGGVVIAKTDAPPTLTVHDENGTDVTFRVLDATIFAAGRDRPYSFGLVAVGDTARVRGGMVGAGRGRGPGRAAAIDTGGLPVARYVMVRPASDRRPGPRAGARGAGALGGAGAGGGSQTGAGEQGTGVS